MSTRYFPPQDQPRPTEILRALRRAYSDDSRLKTTPLEEVSRELIIRGYLQAEFSAALVADVVEVMEAVNCRPGSPTLQPCSIEFFWDDEEGRLHKNIDLSMCIDWVGAPAPWEERSVPESLTHTKSPPCTDLISEPEGVLRNKERWPTHLCSFEFLDQSRRLWAEAQPFVGQSVNILRWAYMYPLPIGRQALMANREVDDLSEWSEVLNVLPFEEDETAMWALRVRVGGDLAGRGVLDLFGLAEYPTELHRKLDWPVAGELV